MPLGRGGPGDAHVAPMAGACESLRPGVSDPERFERRLAVYRAGLRTHAVYRLAIPRGPEGDGGLDLETRVIPGNHLTMLTEPHVAVPAPERAMNERSG